jgi:hypothetical protein
VITPEVIIASAKPATGTLLTEFIPFIGIHFPSPTLTKELVFLKKLFDCEVCKSRPVPKMAVHPLVEFRYYACAYNITAKLGAIMQILGVVATKRFVIVKTWVLFI